MTMPKDRTILEVKTKGRKQEIQIDLYYDSFYLSNFIEANRVKKFINFVQILWLINFNIIKYDIVNIICLTNLV